MNFDQSRPIRRASKNLKAVKCAVPIFGRQGEEQDGALVIIFSCYLRLTLPPRDLLQFVWCFKLRTAA
jgi:hypothetical protein